MLYEAHLSNLEQIQNYPPLRLMIKAIGYIRIVDVYTVILNDITQYFNKGHGHFLSIRYKTVISMLCVFSFDTRHGVSQPLSKTKWF